MIDNPSPPEQTPEGPNQPNQLEYRPARTSPIPVTAMTILEGRLHPLTMVFSILHAVRRLIIPAIPLLFVRNKAGLFGVILVFGLLALGRALVRYFTFNYRIEGNDIITKHGIVERTERHIPLERVQEIRLEQGVLHRLLGVADVVVETAGGKGPEASLSVLSVAEAERLRKAVFERTRPLSAAAILSDPQSQRSVLRRLSLGDLILAGITSNHLVSAMVVVGALLAFMDDVLPETIYQRLAAMAYQSINRVLQEGGPTAVLLTAAAVVLVVIIGTVFSVAGSIILFYAFTLSIVGEDLHRTYGMFTQRSSSLPRRRIQVLEIEEGFLRRLFGLATLRADTAGSRVEGHERRGGRDVILPIVRLADVTRMLAHLLPDLPPATELWNKVSARSITRATVKGAVACALLSLVLLVERPGIGSLWPVALIPLIYLASLVRYRTLGYKLGDRYFQTRRGWLSRSTHVVPIRNAQVIVIRQTLLDRWLGLSTLRVDTAGQAYTG
ncbi:MAG TPA: PH domain-containing protein, partial [Blastocatellia bacterium]|nr:PH domain-containing protein [Blastocatellia bacterium]